VIYIDLFSIENEILYSFLSRSFMKDGYITLNMQTSLLHLSFFFLFFLCYVSPFIILLFSWGRLALDCGRRNTNKCNALRWTLLFVRIHFRAKQFVYLNSSLLRAGFYSCLGCDVCNTRALKQCAHSTRFIAYTHT
jgi:hypothetical protein